MDKYELVLDIIEHPQKYSSVELESILSDPETRDIYNVLCKTDSALESAKEVDVEEEWKRFSLNVGFSRRRFRFFGGRAASVIAIIASSLAAIAVGITVTVAITEHKNELLSAETVGTESTGKVATLSDKAGGEGKDAGFEKIGNGEILFEDEPLSTIMDTVCSTYSVEARFSNEEVAALHLYYRLDPTMDLDEVISQLNTFESINITKDGNLLIID